MYSDADIAEMCETCKYADEELVRYRWHDLRKNPEDMPSSWEIVLFYTVRYDYKVGYVVNCECDRDKAWYIDDDDEFIYCQLGSPYVIAWKYIEPFEA